MGCIFACFRVRDNRHLPTTTTTTVSSSRPSKPNDVVVSRNRLSTLFLSEEREDAACSEGKNFGVGFQSRDTGLKDEAMFLKARGTLPRTEIRKASEKLQVSPCGKDSEPSRCHSWLPNTSADKVKFDDQPFNPANTINCSEEWGKRTDSVQRTPSSCLSIVQNTKCDSLDSTQRSKTGSLHTSDRTENTTSLSPWPSVTYTMRRNKSVHFECETDLSSYDSSDHGGWYMKKTESPVDDLHNGKPQVQSQLGYPIHDQGKNVSQGKILDEEGVFPMQPQNENKPTKGLKKVSYENESEVEESLSSWLKPASVILEERNKRMEMAYSQIHKTPADRPIIGMVAAHWTEDEDSHVPPPKWWDGNGIPNSTNKYKEDQKVNWHATPFEERLEKALSEESTISQRKDFCGKPVAFNENEESDTAISQLPKSSPHPLSVVSF